jgi:raffinose/stachyose/melibiose transport system permease protein
MILPTFTLLVVFLLYPSINAIIKSFFQWRLGDYYNPKFIGLGNFVALLKDQVFIKSVGILAICVTWQLFILIFATMPLTYLVYKLGDSRTAGFFKTLYVLPYMIPLIVGVLFWKFFYDPNMGLLNAIFEFFGANSSNLPVWLGDKQTALPAILFVGFPYINPFNFLIFLAGFQSISDSLHDAALIDGAGPFAQFLRIDIPIIIPQIKILVMLTLIDGFQQYYIQMVLTNGGPNYATMVPGLWLYQKGIQAGNYGYGSAIGVFLFVIILLTTILVNGKLKKKD